MKRRRFGQLGDTCCCVSGWGIRGVFSSIFWLFFEFVRFFYSDSPLGVFHICKNFGRASRIFLSIFR